VMKQQFEQYGPDLAKYEAYLAHNLHPDAYSMLNALVSNPALPHVNPTTRAVVTLAAIQNELDRRLFLPSDHINHDSVGLHARRVAEGVVFVIHSQLGLSQFGESWATPYQTYSRAVLHDIGKIGKRFYRSVVQRPDYRLSKQERGKLLPMHTVDGAILTHYVWHKLKLGPSIIVATVAGSHHLATNGYPTRERLTRHLDASDQHIDLIYDLHKQYSGVNRFSFSSAKIKEELARAPQWKQMFMWGVLEALATNGADVTDAIVSNRGYNNQTGWHEGIDFAVESISRTLPLEIVSGVKEYFYSFDSFSNYNDFTMSLWNGIERSYEKAA
jgi:hypothetical protein